MKSRSTRVVLEAGAWGIGLLLCAFLFHSHVEAGRIDAASRHMLSLQPVGAQVQEAGPATSQEAAVVDKHRDSDAIVGRLEIAAIGLSVPILNDYDPKSLKLGVGHIHGTAVPGGLGNMALAGHRDTYFRPLRHIKQGMTIVVLTKEGRYDYIVDSMEVVEPDQVSVLDIHDRPEMTLITCYPFEFIGSAPHRYIVRAHLESIVPTT